jgi:hypothetical protein
LMPACLKNMSSSLAVKKLDVVGAVLSSSGAKYSLQHGATWNRAGVGVWSVEMIQWSLCVESNNPTHLDPGRVLPLPCLHIKVWYVAHRPPRGEMVTSPLVHRGK